MDFKISINYLVDQDMLMLSRGAIMRDQHGRPLPMDIGPRERIFEENPELRQRGNWICINIQPTVPWPVRAQTVTFDGRKIWIMPITNECHPGLAIDRPADLDQDEAEALLYRLLSVISWRENCGIAVDHRTGGTFPMMMGMDKTIGFAIRDRFDFTEIINPEEEEPRIALALIREARSLNHYGYAFLSFWRVLELAYPRPNERVAFMEAILPTIDGQGVSEARESIQAADTATMCQHLFASGRCAIAHASGRPIINPDDPRDARRLYRELPLVREMAMRAVEERFGIDTPSTEYRKHLYELRGWKAVLGPETVAIIMADHPPEDGAMIDLPRVHVRLRDCPSYSPLEGMVPEQAIVRPKRLDLEYRTPDGLAAVLFRLNFEDERLEFDLANGMLAHDNGSAQSAEYLRDFRRFFRDMMLNGVLHIWNAEDGSLLSRKDAYLPVNVMIDLDGCNANIAAAEEELDRRLIDEDAG